MATYFARMLAETTWADRVPRILAGTYNDNWESWIMFRLTTKILIMLFLSVALLALGVKAMRNPRQTPPPKAIQQSSNQEVSELLGVLRDEKRRQREPDRVVGAMRRLGEIKS